MSDQKPEFRDDVIRGAGNIAAYRGEKERRTRHLIATGQLRGVVWKEGGTFCMRRSTHEADIKRREEEGL